LTLIIVFNSFQASCQEIDGGHCVWYGVCNREGKIKNCPYDGKAKELNETGIDALKQWCSHLLPSDYSEGQKVFTCCDNEQVRDFQLI
jgi:hypothetical protein